MAIDHSCPSEDSFESFEDSWIERPIMARFEITAALYPNKIAVDDGTSRLTYSELRSAALHLAHRIERVASPGRPIGILLPNGALFPIATLACLAVGRICIPIDLSYPEERNEQIVREACLAAVIVDGEIETSRIAPASLPHLDITASLGANGDQAIAFAPANCPAIILYTSGSSGQPKGICNDQRAISQRVAQFTNACHLHAADRFILLSSPATIAGIRDTFAALLNGATVYIADPHRVGMSGIMRVLQDKQITICYAVPALFRALLTLPDARQACRHLRIVRLGGDQALASDVALWQRLLAKSCRLLIGYGSTEVPTAFQWFVPKDWTTEAPRVPIGYPQPGISIELINDDGKPATAGEFAELVFKSRYLALGVWQNGRLLPGDFLTSPDDPSVRILYTGDLARLRDDGLVEFVGRKDRVIKIRGKRVDLLEIDEVLRNCDNIIDAAVSWRGDDENPTLVAYVVTNASDTRLVAQQINLAISARLPGYMRPTQFRIVDAIPRLPSLKPDIHALAKLDTVSLAVFESGPARGMEMSKDRVVSRRVRAAVKKAWTEVLGRKSFAANLRWDQAGGDSLNALRLWFFIEELLDKRLPLDALDSSATPSDLIAAIEKLLDSAPFPFVSNQDAQPLVFFMPPYDGDAPNLVRLRAEFQGKLRFAVAHYPSWREMCRAGARFDLIIDAVMAQVIATFGKNDCLLAGYSFGGFVAWEVARRLMESGRRVAFVGLIDTRRKNLTNPPGSRSTKILRLMQDNTHVANGIVLNLVIRPLIYVSAFPILHAIGNLAMLLPARAAFQFHSTLIAELRLQALWKSETKPLQMPVTLFRSDEQLSTSPDFGWGALCAKLDVVPIGGSHGSMLEPPRRALLCKRFLATVERASQKSDLQPTES